MPTAAPHWPSLLDATERGPRANITNAVRILQHDPMFSAERLWYDEFLDRVIVRDSPPREWRDDDDTRTTVYMQEVAGVALMPEHLVAKAVQMVARQRRRHVVREWLSSLTWDGEDRLTMAFGDYWGAFNTEHVMSASKNFFIGLVARVLRPGCKLDTMPVFEGKEGIKKSTALSIVGGEWYSVARERIDHKDFLQGLKGKWLLEMGELQALSRVEQTAVRMMMSTQVDDYRPSYAKHVVSFPRQCAFAGTTNSDEWGQDSFGLRRYWPIRCGEINLDALAAARDQLFAEAVVRFNAGESWWEMPENTLDVQAERQFYDEWSAAVLEYARLQGGDRGIAIFDIMTNGLKLHLSQIDRLTQMRVASILRLAGYERRSLRIDGLPQKRWYRPNTLG